MKQTILHTVLYTIEVVLVLIICRLLGIKDDASIITGLITLATTTILYAVYTVGGREDK